MLYIIYFNLKNGVSQKEYVNKLKEIMDFLEDKVEGFGLGNSIDTTTVQIQGIIKCIWR